MNNDSPQPSSACQCDDILLLGRSGFGKSTTGNKLLDDGGQSDLQGTFAVSDSPASVTAQISVLSNDVTGFRVFDVPGFADSKSIPNSNVFQRNVDVMRQVFEAQCEAKAHFRAVLYFLPWRGPPDRADGVFQEELKVLAYFYGPDIFKAMVMISTNSPDDDYQRIGFSENNTKKTREFVAFAIKGVIGDVAMEFPPVVYLPFNKSAKEIQDIIKNAIAGKNEPLQLKVQEGVCLKCGDKVRHSGNGRPVDVIKTNGTIVEYINSKCHPQITPRYSTRAKIAGSALHIATAGIPYAIAKISKGRIKTWPGIFNEEKWCISCKAKPGSDPCTLIDTVYSSTAGNTIYVNHSADIN